MDLVFAVIFSICDDFLHEAYIKLQQLFLFGENVFLGNLFFVTIIKALKHDASNNSWLERST